VQDGQTVSSARTNQRREENEKNLIAAQRFLAWSISGWQRQQPATIYVA